MMKTLADSALIRYEPYVGVSLTDAGRKLATHVLRRHRLVELFLVRIMGMDWSEVHAEAEVLEHAVSEGLIERIDEMLGHPTVDPHGDPIPTAGGHIEEPDLLDLVTCEIGRPLSIARVTDQRAEFLQLLEKHGLMPGRRAQVQSRDDLAETVCILPDDGPSLQLGFHAATRVLVSEEGLAPTS
jgi:DtxR family Mn-dependent transcriptional regulator